MTRSGKIEAITSADDAEHRADKLRQTIKWVVYSLLLVNWGYYMFDDWRAAQYTLSESDSILKWMNAYTTSLDELAWFGMLFLFEAETYWLSDEALSHLKRFMFVTLRVVCYAFLAHTLFAYVTSYYELANSVALSSNSTVCDLTGQDYSFLRNLAYTVIDATNCGGLAIGTNLFQVGNDLVVTDTAGLAEATALAVVDIVDAITWLAVVLTIESVVIIQEKGISDGSFITSCNYLTLALYAVLVFDAGFWAWKGHYVYTWDQLLWIGGFAAIEMNLSEWRDEIDEAAASA